MKRGARRGSAATGVSRDGGAPHKDIAIYGRRSVEAALAARRREIREIWVAEGAGGQTVDRILSLAVGQGIPLRRVPESAIERACGGTAPPAAGAHQGVLLYARPLPATNLSDLVAHSFAHKNGEPVFVALDRVQDPRHLGAVIRLAEALGAAGLLFARKGSAPLAGAALKAASGAAEYLPILETGDLVEALRLLAGSGIRVIAADALSPHDLGAADLSGGICLVIGSEGEGISPRVAALADVKVRIPLSGRTESLSLSSAAGILLYEASRRRKNPAR